MNETPSVAKVIRDQIGARALYMIGAKDLLAAPRALSFRIRGSSKINSIHVALADDDTDTVGFFRIRGARITLVSTVESVYADSLRTVIERHTGLYTSL